MRVAELKDRVIEAAALAFAEQDWFAVSDQFENKSLW